MVLVNDKIVYTLSSWIKNYLDYDTVVFSKATLTVTKLNHKDGTVTSDGGLRVIWVGLL